MDNKARKTSALSVALLVLGSVLAVVGSAAPAGAAGPTVSLTPLPASINFGDFEDASALITDGDSSGDLTISIYSDAACTVGTWSVNYTAFGAGPFSGDETQINDEFAGLGTWSMQAVYTGDISGLTGTSPCVPFTVNPGVSVTGVTANAWPGSGPLTAHATVNDTYIHSVHTGAVYGLATFGLYKNATCTVPVSGYAPETVALDLTDSLNPVADTPSGFVPVEAGSYYWQASYAGNSVYGPSQSACTPALLNFAPIPTGGGVTGACGPIPSAPTKVSSGPGNGSATVSWAPSLTGCVAGYIVTPYLGTVPVPELSKLIPGTGTTTVVKGLTNGKSYRFTVEGENGTAVGPASAFTAPTTSGAPSAPGGVHATKVSKGALKVAFTAPANNGSAIVSFAVTCASSKGGVAKTKGGKRSPITVTGLTAGASYTCTVRATNKHGTGPVSRASAAVKA